MELVDYELPGEMTTPAADLVQQYGVGVGAEEAQKLHAELGLRDNNVAAGGVQPDTGYGAVQLSELMVGKNKGIAVSRYSTQRRMRSGRVMKLIAAIFGNSRLGDSEAQL